ncbi:GntR family transcriptional regulator [Rhodanobacter lindaniclasticus]
MFIELDGVGPVYQQLTRALKAAILGGSLGAGTRLPPTRALAQELGISRITVLSAYDQLRAEGYLQSRVGSGSYVSTLQLAPPRRPPKVTAAAMPSRYAQRARLHSDPSISRMHRGLRFNLQYGEIFSRPGLNNVRRAGNWPGPPHTRRLSAPRRKARCRCANRSAPTSRDAAAFRRPRATC